MISLFPEPLKKGDTLGVIAPAGQMQDTVRFEQGIEVLRKMGFHVKYPPHLWAGPGYLADSDDNRGGEFNRLLVDEEVQGLIAMRGGYGCLRMLSKVDIALVARKPKLLVGFSDITILQNYLYEQTGLVAVHGPVVTSLGEATKETLESFYHCLTTTKPYSVGSDCIKVLRDGPDVSAPLIGGNLASLVSLLGTRYDFSWKNKIVFFEDVNEPIYKIDRMLTQLQLAGKFASIAGLVLGDFSNSAHKDASEKERYQEGVWARVLEIFPDKSTPVWGNFPSGHCPCNYSFPIGAVAEMRSRSNRLFFK